jgi:putative oxidoreductase
MRRFFMARFEEATLGLLHLVAGFLIAQHGAQKLFGAFGGMPPAGGSAPLATKFGAAGIIEFVGGVLIALGLFTRPVAFILAGELAVAYFQVHAPNGFWPLLNKGELAVLYCFVFFYLSARGAGKYSVDGLIEGRQGPVKIDTR